MSDEEYVSAAGQVKLRPIYVIINYIFAALCIDGRHVSAISEGITKEV